MEDKMTLGVIEESQIRTAVCQLLASCPFIPGNVSLKYGDMQNDSIGMFCQQGSGRYTKRYVSGKYEAEFPFYLCYRSKPTVNEARLNAEELLDSIAQWMSGKKVEYGDETYTIEAYPSITDNRKIEKIEAGNVYMARKYDDESIDYQATLRLSYSGKG